MSTCHVTRRGKKRKREVFGREKNTDLTSVNLGNPSLQVIISLSVWSCQRFTAIKPSAV